MKEIITKTEAYTLVILKAAQNVSVHDAEKKLSGNREKELSLQDEGKLCIVCPVIDSTDVKGVGIFSTGEKETKKIMDDDPAVKAGIFTYEIHPCRNFPGDRLPHK
jgi:hypothetical protein